mmetsp:Transcript_32143/g.48522  ORF Transcript_32143/g.48522 Transcript_32143/m.48522 type:complete len:299 (-) Transcript_32143:134-1030(-)
MLSVLVLIYLSTSSAFTPSRNFRRCETYLSAINRRDVLYKTSAAVAIVTSKPNYANADAAAIQDSLDVDNFLRTGVDGGGNMGVSSQAGKSRPQTGVVFRDGSEVLQDKRSGQVSAELLTGTKKDPKAVLVSFVSPWKLETGPVFDVECRDGRTGDGAFVAVTKSVGGKSLEDLPSSFFLDRLFDPTGRFSFYGAPTDIKVKSSKISDASSKKRYLELSFSSLSQSTNAEIPRKALLVATLPEGSDNVIMLVGSANASRWSSVKDSIVKIADTFTAIPAPKSNLKLRAKDRSNSIVDF